MGNYKVSGNASDESRVHILKDGEYQGYKDVSSGNYDVNFELDTATGISAIAENSDGEIVGYGAVTAEAGGASDITMQAAGIVIGRMQTVTQTIPNQSGSNTNTSPSLDYTYDPDMTWIILNGFKNDNSNADFSDTNFHTKFNDPNFGQLISNRQGTCGNLTINITLLECTSGFTVTSYGTGQIDSGQLIEDVAISSTNTSNAFINLLGCRANTMYPRDGACSFSFVNSTTIRATRGGSSGNTMFSYQVIEFNSIG